MDMNQLIVSFPSATKSFNASHGLSIALPWQEVPVDPLMNLMLTQSCPLAHSSPAASKGRSGWPTTKVPQLHRVLPQPGPRVRFRF